MAKAQFHKNQRVYVKPVGTWAIIERVIPQWAKGLEEPIRVFYDVGLGRRFGAEELKSETAAPETLDDAGQSWRIIRARNKWQSPDDSTHHPVPGTYPTIVTGEKDWGGWRVPGAEYDLDPYKIEMQARIIANALSLLKLTQELVEFVDENPEDASAEVLELAKRGDNALRMILEQDEPSDQEQTDEPSGVLETFDVDADIDVDGDFDADADVA